MDIDEYAAGVSQLLYGRIDIFPNEIVHGKTKLKCTNGWFTGIFGYCSVGKLKNFVGEMTLSFYHELEQDFRKTRKHDRPTTKEDIIKGNKLLYMILQDCSLQKLKRGSL
ncbi:hypothetical protein J4226_03685 [Candidatus Pacearchaeota archaeon]|nr:hypothetical protein [Candidatus Pacearchaeota archaeon]